MSFKDLIESLNISKIYFSSGLRNSYLLDYFKSSEIIHGFLDQALSFRALGASKESGKVIAVCVTSGSAVAQTLPALIEAYYTGVKLIIISADRPSKMKKTNAPQVIDQEGILKNYTRSFYDIELENDFTLPKIKFPCHLNVRIDKSQSDNTYTCDKSLNLKKPPLFILNSFDSYKGYEELYKVLVQSKCFIYQEVSSPFYHLKSGNEVLYDEQLQKKAREGDFDTIIRIGACPNSKFWRLLESDFRDLNVFHFGDFNFSHLSFGTFLNSDLEFLKLLENESFKVQDYQNKVEKLLEKYPQSELSLFKKVLSKISGKVLVGNSMPIRSLKFFKKNNLEVFTNRGANGIDGILATAIGISENTQSEVSVVLGDLSFLYDLSSLIEVLPKNLKVFIINNNGGRIFERVKGHKDIINEHEFDLEKIIKGFGHTYSSSLDRLMSFNEVKVDNNITQSFWDEYNEIW